MAVETTGWRSRSTECRPSTAKVSLGRKFEICARAYCRRLGYRILQRNLRSKIGEIDILAWDVFRRQLVLVEVRGVRDVRASPSLRLTAQKIARLGRLASALGRRYHRPIRIEFFEVRGTPRRLPDWALAILAHRPRWAGISVRVLKLESEGG